jgi:Flp pilus assembly protein CpaB
VDTTSRLLLAAGVALALLVGAGVYGVVNTVQSTSGNLTPVVVAAQEIPERTQLTAANTPALLTTRQLPADALPPSAARDPAQVIGKTPLLAPLPGEVVIDTPGRLASGEGASARPSAAIPRDKVAFALQTSESMSVAGALQPGDRVDVIAAWTGANNQAIAQTLFPDVRVFAVGRRLDTSRGRPPSAGAAPEAPATVTLLLDPQQAVTTQYLLQNGGNITLVLRRFDQTGDLTSEPVTGESLTRRVLGAASGGGPAGPMEPSPTPGP